MSENRLPDYLYHIQQAAADACSFVEGLAKDDFLIEVGGKQFCIDPLLYFIALNPVIQRFKNPHPASKLFK